MRNLIKSLCSCQTQWHLRQLGGARREARGSNCNCAAAAAAAANATATSLHKLRAKILYWFLAALCATQLAHEYSASQCEYVNMNMGIWVLNIWIGIWETELSKLHRQLSEASKHLHLFDVGQLNWPLGANSRICLWPSHICDKSPHAAANYVPHSCRTCRTLDRS